jgi:hypothetical protein
MNLSRRNYLVLKVGWLTESAAGTYSVAISQVFFQIQFCSWQISRTPEHLKPYKAGLLTTRKSYTQFYSSAVWQCS